MKRWNFKGARSYAGEMLWAAAWAVFNFTERCKPSEWIEKNIYLPADHQESIPGQVSFDESPYLREPLDCLTDPSVQDVVFVAPTRLGKTFLLRMAFAYIVAVLKVPMLWYDSILDKARGISQKEFQPMIDANECLRSRKPSNRHHFTNTRMLFPAAHFEMFGANSDAQASGETACVVFGNECDKWRESTEKEAGIGEQVRHRTESFEDERKHYFSSTPTLEEGFIWSEQEKGDKRRWFVKCNHCGHEQELLWEHVDFSWHPDSKKADGSWDLEVVKENTKYKCCSCGEHIDQTQLREIIKQGQWIPTATGQPGIRSYAINGLYGPLKSNTMGALAVDFLSARTTGFYVDRQDFWNARMGLPWIDDVRTLKKEQFVKFEANCLRGEIPEDFNRILLSSVLMCRHTVSIGRVRSLIGSPGTTLLTMAYVLHSMTLRRYSATMRI